MQRCFHDFSVSLEVKIYCASIWDSHLYAFVVSLNPAHFERKSPWRSLTGAVSAGALSGIWSIDDADEWTQQDREQ